MPEWLRVAVLAFVFGMPFLYILLTDGAQNLIKAGWAKLTSLRKRTPVAPINETPEELRLRMLDENRELYDNTPDAAAREHLRAVAIYWLEHGGKPLLPVLPAATEAKTP